MPAIPERARRRHLYVLGRTGSGKTTYLEHRINEDLAAGYGVGVFGPEGEFFRDRLLPLVPPRRIQDVIYFAPGNQACPLKFNPLALEPGDDPARTAEDLFTIFRRVLATEGLGPRMGPILQNAFAALIGREGMTLWHVTQLLTDSIFRRQIVRSLDDPYVRGFWEKTYPQFPRGAELAPTTCTPTSFRPWPEWLREPGASF